MAQAQLTAEFAGNCQSLLVILAKQSTNAKYTIALKHVSTTTVVTGQINTATSNSYSFVNLSLEGVYELKLTGSDGVIQDLKYLVSTCAVDKCLVLLTDKLLSCGCTSPKCSVILDKAQKVMLLLNSSTSTASRIIRENVDEVLIGDAQAQYKKAIELCGGNCDCGC
mgnify:CR=1 FL=1